MNQHICDIKREMGTKTVGYTFGQSPVSRLGISVVVRIHYIHYRIICLAAVDLPLTSDCAGVNLYCPGLSNEILQPCEGHGVNIIYFYNQNCTLTQNNHRTHKRPFTRKKQ
jgi:hypothetical protein